MRSHGSARALSNPIRLGTAITGLPGTARGRTLAFDIAIGLLVLQLLALAVLSADVLVRLVLARDWLGGPLSALGLIGLESVRTVTIAITLVLVFSVSRNLRWAPARAFALFVLFIGVWYAKVFAFDGYVGHLQDRLARWLFASGVPRTATAFVFGMPVWASWLALGAFLRLAVIYPVPLTASRIHASGGRDRSGLLRSVALAGLDVGQLLRSATARLLENGWLRPVALWPVVAVAGTAHAFATGAWRLGFLAVFAVLVAIGITAARAGRSAGNGQQRRRVSWFTQAAILAASAFLFSGLLSLAQNAVAYGLSFAVATVAPLAVVGSLFLAATPGAVTDPQPAIRRTLRFGCAIIAGAAVFVGVEQVLPPLSLPRLTLRPLLALATSLGLVLALRPRLRHLTDRLTGATAR